MFLSKYIDIEHTRWRPPILMLSIAAFLVFLAAELFELPKNMMFWRELQNAGHIPVFGLVTILVIWLGQRYLGIKSRYLIINYILAVGIASVLGLLLEVYQYFGPRDADWGDLVRDVSGAAAFGFIYLAFDRQLLAKAGKWGKAARMFLIGLALAILIAAIVPLIDLANSYVQRNKHFPVICDFEESWQADFTVTQGSVLENVPVLDSWPGDLRGRAGKLVFSHSKYPGISFREPVRDWTSYNSLHFDVYSELPSAFDLLVRVNDKYHNNSYSDRFNALYKISPGLNEIKIPLKQIRKGPRSREMDMASISLIVLFVANPKEPFAIYIDNIRLEK